MDSSTSLLNYHNSDVGLKTSNYFSHLSCLLTYMSQNPSFVQSLALIHVWQVVSTATTAS